MTILTAIVAALTQAAATPAPLAPTSKWNVDYADNMCTLSRSYGTGQRPLLLGFKPSPMSDSLQLVLIAPGTGRPAYVTVKVAINGVEAATSAFSMAFTSKSSQRVHLIDMKRADFTPLERRGTLTVTVGKSAPVHLIVDRFDLASKGLADCEKNLLEHWGMSAAEQAAIVARPVALQNPAAYINSNDYPVQALRNNEQGASGVRYRVGTDGSAQDCQVVESSGSLTLDQTTCAIIMRRVRFSPALDREGKPVSSLTFSRIRWVLPS
jgi:TonB family protein